MTQENKEEENDVQITTTVDSCLENQNLDSGMAPHRSFENTYQIEPTSRFRVKEVQDIIDQVLSENLTGKTYSKDESPQMTKDLSDLIKNKVKELNFARYKILCTVTIGEVAGQGCKVASRFLWFPETDSYASSKFQNDSLFATATVYGLHAE
eukprot:Nk52_evm24s239 gene=Nk52_evmTU24s239